MRSLYLLRAVFIVAAAIAIPAKAQVPTPTQTPVDDVVKISTTLIQLDLNVTDKRGRPITDLKPDEIEIYENGHKRDVSNLNFVSVPKSEHTKAADRTPTSNIAGPPPPQVELHPEQVRRTMAIVIDDLTMSMRSIYDVQRALKKFVDEQMQPGDMVAIIRAGAGIGALQQFTGDKAQLYAAIERIRWNPYTGKVGYFDSIDEDAAAAKSQGNDEGAKGIRGDMQGEDEYNQTRQDAFNVGVLGALNFVIRGMRELPGRKSVMLFSEGFDMHSDDTRFIERMHGLMDNANRSSVVIYTTDPRGVVVTGLGAVDAVSSPSVRSMSSMGGDAIRKAQSDRDKQIFATRGGLVFLAEHTGGKAIYGTNDLSGAIREILDDQSYYLVGFEPGDGTFDPRNPRFNSIEVKVNRPGTLVRYRSGFYGVTDRPRIEREGRSKFFSAFMSPFAVNEVTLRLNALYVNDPKQGSMIKTLLHVNAGDLTFKQQPNGTMQTIFDLIAAPVGDNGAMVANVNKTYTVSVKRETYERFLKTGFVYSVDLPIVKPGPYQVRIAIQDKTTGRVGAANQFVNIPDKKSKLNLSGVLLEDLPLDEWKQRVTQTTPIGEGDLTTDPLIDTSSRQFKRGTVLNYGFTIYNAKLDPAKQPKLTMRIRVYRGDKLLLEGSPRAVDVGSQSDSQRIAAAGSLNLGEDMEPGDYVLQIIITDQLASAKNSQTGEFVNFQLVN